MTFGRLERSTGPKPMGDINMTPLIDVMLVLLVIFMITAPLMSSSLRLDLPKLDAAKPSDAPQFLQVALTPDGGLYLGDEKLDASAMREKLGQAALRTPGIELQLRADKAVPYGRVAELIAWAQEVGLNRIAFVTQPGESGAQ
jgi:biopolymer transport protein ExbD/biopolymer transport protein TolR